MSSRDAPYAPTGRPPPMIFPKQLISGRTPNRPCARELENRVSAGRGAREPERAHDRLGAARYEADHVHARHGGGDLLRELDFEGARRAVRRAAPRLCLDRRDHIWMGVPSDERAPRRNKVNIFAAVGGGDVATLPPHDQRLLAPDGAVGAHRAGHAARHDPARALEELAVRADERHRSRIQAAASSAKYVTIMSAPARAIPVSDSSAPRRRSIQPRAEAAWSAAYSPLTWYATRGVSKRPRAAAITSRYGPAGLTMNMSAPSSRSAAISASASRPLRGSI